MIHQGGGRYFSRFAPLLSVVRPVFFAPDAFASISFSWRWGPFFPPWQSVVFVPQPHSIRLLTVPTLLSAGG